MAFQLFYGDRKFSGGENTITIVRPPIYSARGYRIATRERWTIDGVLHAADSAAVTTALNTLQSDLAKNDETLVLTTDGTVESTHKLAPADMVGGVRVVALEYPEGGGGEYSTYRTYRIVIEAIRDDAEQDLLSFQEVIRQVGGGERKVWLEILNGPPQLQITNRQTTQLITQSGNATSYTAQPQPAFPLLPLVEHIDRRQIVRRSPEEQRGDFRGFTTEWTYVFETGTPVDVSPHITL